MPTVYESEREGGYLHSLLGSFQRELLPTLKLKADNEKDYSFADIYAQTIAYGLFTARVFSYTIDERKRVEEQNPERKETDFNRQNAGELLPETNPFLRRLFQDVSQRPPEELGDDLIDAISEVVSILRAARMDAILADFRAKMNREDIVIRFYEDFLAAYKPKMRERRGVYYTPEPVVSYMVRSVDVLLKEKFNKPLGLADPEVMILDPACGTGTFLLWIFQLIYDRFQENSEALTEGLEERSWSGYVKERLLPRIFGFELLMAPYAIAHLKLGLFLEETGYQFDSGKKLGVYLTNSLENSITKAETLLEEFIAEEAAQAVVIKRDKPITVMIGNPPYAVSSANRGRDIENLMESYKTAVYSEYNRQPLSDDYIKFIRFAHARIEQTQHGIIAMITNHSYLSGLIHRGMREELIKSFEEIYLLDLHGNALMEERPSDNNVDANVFDIRQGVSINLLIKKQEKDLGRVNYANVWGSRESKYSYLEKNNTTTTEYSSLSLVKPYFFFVPKNFNLSNEYDLYADITEIFNLYQRGIATRRDHFMVDFDKDELENRISIFVSDLEDREISRKFNIKTTEYWDLSRARNIVRNLKNTSDKLYDYSYRPFDIRQVIYITELIERGDAAYRIMQHMLHSNIALLGFRRIRDKTPYQFFVAQGLIDKTFLSSKDNVTIFPLHLYPDVNSTQASILEEFSTPNISKKVINNLRNSLGYVPTSESIFYYIYAVLSSPLYRTRYAEFLKIDFPRVPFTSNNVLFRRLATFGEELVALHLMKSSKLDTLVTQFIELGGDRAVDPGHPKYADGKVTINKKGDGFIAVPETVWNFYVGGYQVCQKWLKDRKGRTLSNRDIQHYQRIIVALNETIKLMAKIDAAIPSFPIE